VRLNSIPETVKKALDEFLHKVAPLHYEGRWYRVGSATADFDDAGKFRLRLGVVDLVTAERLDMTLHDVTSAREFEGGWYFIHTEPKADEPKTGKADGIKVGDVVVLKSGGPKMTVSYVGPCSLGPSILKCVCVWFEGYTIHSREFAAEAIERF